MLKRIIAVSLMIAFTVSFAACSSGSKESQGKGDYQDGTNQVNSGDQEKESGGIDKNVSMELRIITHFTDQARRDLLTKAIEKFKEKWPNVTLVDETTSEYQTKIKLEFSSGNGPDIVTVDDLYQQTLMKGNYLADITDLVEKYGWIEKSVPGAVQFNNLRTPGKYYSVPFLMAPVVFYYNKDIFSELGVSVPTTMEELEEVFSKAKQEGYIPMADAGISNMNVMWLIYHMVFNNTDMEDIREWYYQRSTPDSVREGFIEAFRKIAEWTNNGYFGDVKIAMGLDYDTYVSNLYAKGTVAMIMDGDWNMGPFKDSGINTGILAFPSEYIVNATDSGWALNAEADDTKKAIFGDFVDIFFTEDVVKEYYVAGYTPSVKFNTSGLEVDQLKIELQNSVSSKKFGYFLDNAVPGLFDVFQKATQQLMLGEITPEECWEQINSGYEKGKAEVDGQ